MNMLNYQMLIKREKWDLPSTFFLPLNNNIFFIRGYFMFFHNSIWQTFFHLFKCQLAREIRLKVTVLFTNNLYTSLHYLFRLRMMALTNILSSFRSNSSSICLTVLKYSWSAVRTLLKLSSAVMLSLLSRWIWEGQEEGGEATGSSRMLCSSSTIIARSSDTSEQVLKR